ncbi:MAG: VWA domain-containing protein [Methanothrix sp.]|nr:VWA domain-containing protein [Methanothrix sp.]
MRRLGAEYSEERIYKVWERSRASWHRPQLPRPIIDGSEDADGFPFKNYRIVIDSDALEKGEMYLENFFDHLIVHYLFCPRSLETAGRLSLAALEGLEKKGNERDQARRMVNIFSDIVVDTFRLERSAEDEEKVLLGWRDFAKRSLSPLDEAVVGLLAELWNVDLPSSDRPESEMLLSIFSWGVKDRSKWPRQCMQMARVLGTLAPGILGSGMVPSIEGLGGNAHSAPLSGLASDLEPDIYREALSVLGLEGDLLRWYRDQSYSIVIRPTSRARESCYPSSLVKWRISDPPSELDVAYSLSLAPRLIPGVTTYRRVQECCGMAAGSEKVPDLLVVLDSSGSMGGHRRGTKTHAATLAALKASSFAHSQGAELAAISFSDRMVVQEWTRDLVAAEKVLVQHLGSRIHIPGEEVLGLAGERPGCLILCITDTHIQNLYNEWDSIKEATALGRFVLFSIDEANKNKQVDEALGDLGAVYRINRLEDLLALVIETAEEAYRPQEPHQGRQSGESFISSERMGTG